jgi:GTP-binding protein
MPEIADARQEAGRIAAQRIEAGRLFFARPWHFIAGAPVAASLPVADPIEVAFAGRSNVGKSSLINALTGQKALARTSNTPGRTRELNLFGAEAGVAIVDMPGYGYARAAAAPPRLRSGRRPPRAQAQRR